MDANQRLFVYGSLAPGESNAHILTGLSGHWQRATVRGHLIRVDSAQGIEYPGITLNDDGPEIDGHVLTSRALPYAWLDIDEFEGDDYRRVVANVSVENDEYDVSVVPANVYALVDPEAYVAACQRRIKRSP